jgi:hypothetical protein
MADAGIWVSLIGVILFVVAAFLTLQIVLPVISDFQTSFEATICKFNAWTRSNTIGNPMVQSLISASDMVTGGFGGQIASSMSVPLICSKAKPLPRQSEPYTIKAVVDKLAYESINCWDQFGRGAWDPLVLSQEGQSFTCYEQSLTIKCLSADLIDLWDFRTSDVQRVISESSGNFTQEVFHYYLSTNSLKAYGGGSMTYASVLPNRAPVFGKAFGSGSITCDDTQRDYLVSIHFIDVFTGGLRGQQTIPLVCESINTNELGSDTLYLCITEYRGGFI